MKFHVGSDHAGFHLKTHLVEFLRESGHEVIDHGTDTDARVDYPDFAGAVSRAVQAAGGAPDVLGLIICGSGIGVSITANRFKGVRAVVAAVEVQAELARAHNNANVLCMGERITATLLAEKILSKFITTKFEGGRHTGRVELIEKVSDA